MLHALNHLLIGQAAPVAQLAIKVHRLLTGVRHVERIVHRLRIQHQSNLLALIHVPYQLLVLGSPLLLIARHERLLLLIVSRQFRTQDAQRTRQITLLQHRLHRLDSDDQCHPEKDDFTHLRNHI